MAMHFFSYAIYFGSRVPPYFIGIYHRLIFLLDHNGILSAIKLVWGRLTSKCILYHQPFNLATQVNIADNFSNRINTFFLIQDVMPFTYIHLCFNKIDKSVTKITKAIRYLTTPYYRCFPSKYGSTIHQIPS